MIDMEAVSHIDVNLSAVQHNIRLLKRIVGPECELCPIVKSDAYGLGAVRVTKTLMACGVDLVAVFTPEEATQLFAAAIGGQILVLMPVRQIPRAGELYRGLVCGRLHLVVHDAGHLQDMIGMAERFGVRIPIHLEVDTGMSRGGCSLSEAPALLESIGRHNRLSLAGLFTHFARAEEDIDFTDVQAARFDRLLEDCANLIPPACRIHMANSFATLRSTRYHRSMVRVGLAWAGYGLDWLSGGELIVEGEHLEPAVTWESRIVQIKTIDAGTPVGYGSKWTAGRRTHLGLIPVGYAHGYPMSLGATDERPRAGMVRVLPDCQNGAAGGFARVVGAVNMDQIAVDLTDLMSSPKARTAIATGTRVELITADPVAPNHVTGLARAAGTIPHELLCRMDPRCHRSYHVAAAATHTLPTTAAALAG